MPSTSNLIHAVVNRNTAGNGTAVVAGVANKRVVVRAYSITAAAGVVVFWVATAAGVEPAPRIDTISLVSGRSYSAMDHGDIVLPPTGIGQGLFLNLSAAVQVDGALLYELV